MLPVPHYRQSRSYTCLPACVRMILAYHDKHHTEAELASLFGAVLLGTLPENVVNGLEQLGYRGFWFENATPDRLSNLLEHGWPVIVFGCVLNELRSIQAASLSTPASGCLCGLLGE